MITENGECMKYQMEMIYDTVEFEIKCHASGCKYSSGIGTITELRKGYKKDKYEPIDDSEDGCLTIKPKRGFEIHRFKVNAGKIERSINVKKNTSKGLFAEPTGFPIHLKADMVTTGQTSYSYTLPKKNHFRLYQKKFPLYWENDTIES